MEISYSAVTLLYPVLDALNLDVGLRFLEGVALRAV